MAPKPAKPAIPSLHSLHAQVLLAIADAIAGGTNLSYKELGESVGRHENSIARVVDEMVDAGWINKTRRHRYNSFTIHREALTGDGRTLGDWLSSNPRSARQ